MNLTHRSALGALLGLLVSTTSPLVHADPVAAPATKAASAAAVDTQLLEAQLAIRSGQYAKAVSAARASAARSLEAKIVAAPLEARALALQGKTKDAISLLESVANEDKAFRANLELGALLIATGQRAAARPALMRVIDGYNNDELTDAEGLTLVGRAAHLLRNAKEANNAYNMAERAGGKKYVETLLSRAELFLDKYDSGHAGEVIKEALALAPGDPDAHVLMARVKLDSSMDFRGAEEEIKAALAVNPSLAAAYAVRAGLALRDMDLEQALDAVDTGLKTNPEDLELLSMKAAARFLADDEAGFEAIKTQVFAINPEYSSFYGIVGEYAEWEHRYDDIVRMMREAVAVDPRDAKAYAALGLNLIRAGEEDDGLEALRQAWKLDHFNVRVFNTLNLYEKSITAEYVTVDGKPFKIRYQKDEKPVLERYVPRMLDAAWASMVKRYGFTPSNPVFIELYADPEHFSVRTSGLPNVGIQGVCFGKTLAAMSPGAGSFNWGNVLWHELAHVFAIQLSKNHVPRWFTEGLSEYETIIVRPEWQREEDPALYQALRDGRIPPVEGMNRAFTHVDKVSDVTMAYYAASQIVTFQAKEFGFDPLVKMLKLWGDGQPTAGVVRDALGISSTQLDGRFRSWVEKKLSRYDKQFMPNLSAPPLAEAERAVLASPKSAGSKVKLALALIDEGQIDEAARELDEALALDPSEPDGNYLKVKFELSKKDHARAKKRLEAMIAAGHDGYAVRMRAADAAEMAKDAVGMRRELEAATRLDPSQSEPLQALYDVARRRGDSKAELTALRGLARLEQHDRRVYLRLLEALLREGHWEEARQVGESAMYIDVMNPEAHRLYARALIRTGHLVQAVYELNSALYAKPGPRVAETIYRNLATAYEKLKRPDLAKEATDLADRVKAGGPASAPPVTPPPSRPSAKLETLARPG